MKPSRVLPAMHVPHDLAGSVIRVSFGPFTSEEELGRLLEAWRGISSRGRAAAA